MLPPPPSLGSFAHAIRPADKIFYLPMAMDPRPFAYQLTCSLRKKRKKRKREENILRGRALRDVRRWKEGWRVEEGSIVSFCSMNLKRIRGFFPVTNGPGKFKLIFGVKFILFEESRYYIDISLSVETQALSLSLLMTDHSTAPWYYNFIKSALARLPKTFVSIPRTFLPR